MVDGALEILKPSLRKSGIQLSIEIQPEDIEVRANNVLLQQVLVNLISNGMQAIDGQAEKKITVEAKPEGSRVVIAVEDTGTGVSDEHFQKIFDPFYTTKKSGQGLGLGLTISDRIIRESGGQMKLIKTVKGARFEISLNRA